MPRKLSPDKLVLRLLEATPTPVYLLDPQHCLAFVNTACEAWLGEPAQRLMGRKCEYRATENAAPVGELHLAPPPESFAGQAATGYVAGAADSGRVRTCQFQPLTISGVEGTFVLAIVDAQPVSAADVEAMSKTATDSQRLHAQLLELRAAWKKRYKSAPFVGVTAASQRIRSQIRLAAAGARRVLIVGPAGSGREHVARAIHFSQSGEPGPLISVACALLDAELIQQTLAAFLKKHPSDKSSNAALLLHDVDRLSTSAQHELSEFLRLPGVDLTIRATARRSLQRLARRGRFREDLAQALGTLTIAIPSLKERPEDIPLLAQHFVEQHNALAGRQFSGFSVDALDELAGYAWPGHTDELLQVVRECCERAPGPYITPADLPEQLRHDRFAAAHPSRAPETIQLDSFLAGIEKELLERALKAAKGNKTRAASLLGIHRARLIRRLVQLGLVELTPADQTAEAADEVVIFEPHPDET